jgi:hypothetical protein
MESFDLRPSNQYILVGVIPSCFRFEKMFLCQITCRVKLQPEILDTFFMGELYVVYMQNNETNYVPTASAICGVKTENARLDRLKPMGNP